MKKAKKIATTVLAASLLVTATVSTTVAYLTSKDEVKNTFTVGDIVIDMDETDVDFSSDTDRDKFNKYHIIPGGEYEKDPIIHIGTSSEDCYVFVKVDNGIKSIELSDTETANNTIKSQMLANGWTLVEGETDVYKLNRVATKDDENIPVFESFKIREDVDNETLAQYADANVVVKAYAIQAEGFSSAEEAWIAAPTDWK